MRGVGRIFRLFRCGGLTHSDEVYVLHAPESLRYRGLTLPLVNIRFTLRAMRLAGHLTRSEERAVTMYMHEVPWLRPRPPFTISRHLCGMRTLALRSTHADV